MAARRQAIRASSQHRRGKLSLLSYFDGAMWICSVQIGNASEYADGVSGQPPQSHFFLSKGQSNPDNWDGTSQCCENLSLCIIRMVPTLLADIETIGKSCYVGEGMCVG